MHVLIPILANPVRVLAAWGLMAVAAGCGGPAMGEVSGAISLGGQPLNEGVVTFENAAKGQSQSAPIAAGAYKMPSPMPVGDYKVTLQPPPPPAPTAAPSAAPKTSIPTRFMKTSTTDLTATVKAGSNKVDFTLKF